MEHEFLLERYLGLLGVSVVVNGVDIPTDVPAGPRSSGRFEVVFPANFAYPPNLWAAREIVEDIAPALPEAHFLLAGAHAPDSLARDLPSNVTLISPVEDMSRLFARANAAVMPVRAGAGTRLKALECLAWGVPIVGTSFATEGIAVRANEEFLLAETPADFIQNIRRLMDDTQLATSLVARGKLLVEGMHSIAEVGRQIHDSLGSLDAAVEPGVRNSLAN